MYSGWTWKSRLLAVVVAMVMLSPAFGAQDSKDAEESDGNAVPLARGQGFQMDYGPFLSYTINCKPRLANGPDNLALKGIAIKLGPANEGTICFDTELMRYAAGWTGGFLDISKT